MTIRVRSSVSSGRSHRRGRLTLLPAVLLLVGACGAQSTGPRLTEHAASTTPVSPARVVNLDFEDSYTVPGGVVAAADNGGSAKVAASVVTSDGGRITRARGVASSSALRFPAFSQGPTPAAVLLLRQKGATDVLSPGEHDFSFGADFNLDPVSSGSATDNGDNLVQRGLSSDAAQYKLQLDHGTPSCRVAGSAGEALAAAPDPVVTGGWYRVSCRRTGDTLVLVVRRLGDSGPESKETTTVQAPTGSVEMPPEVPLSVGGKVSPGGEITVSATDQFNGLVDNVFLELQE